jgi:hypothetical protein
VGTRKTRTWRPWVPQFAKQRDGTHTFTHPDGQPIGTANPTLTQLTATARTLTRAS